MTELEQTLTSIEVAELLEVEHWQLLRKLSGRTGRNGKHIKGYIEILGDNQVVVSDFFKKSTYFTEQNKEMPCYKVTKKGCEFLANKFTGEKGVLFTARYINRFHEMEDILKGQQEPEMPWFIRDFKGEGKIMLFRDFKTITGIELAGVYTAWERPDKLVGGLDWNGWGWKCDNEKFKAKYGFDFGEGPTLDYLYLRGIRKAIRAIENDMKDRKRLSADAKKLILDGVESVEGKKKTTLSIPKSNAAIGQKQIQITLILNQDGIVQQI